jgi:hypothetical protein
MSIKFLLLHKYKVNNVFMLLGIELFGTTIGIGYTTCKFEDTIALGFIFGSDFE